MYIIQLMDNDLNAHESVVNVYIFLFQKYIVQNKLFITYHSTPQ